MSSAALLAAACQQKTVTVNVEQERTALMQRDRDWSQTTKDPNQFLSYFTSDGSWCARHAAGQGHRRASKDAHRDELGAWLLADMDSDESRGLRLG